MGLERLTPEQKLVLAAGVAATGVAIEDLIIGPDPMRDLITFWMVANVTGVPVTPMIEVFKEGIQKLAK